MADPERFYGILPAASASAANESTLARLPSADIIPC